MSAPKIGLVLSPVDYDAWNRGYMPPSEHILIDALAYRGARVVMSQSTQNAEVWLVVKGQMTPFPRDALRAVHRAIADMIEVLDEYLPATGQEPAPASAAESTAAPSPPTGPDQPKEGGG
jgi:hypothetical protein